MDFDFLSQIRDCDRLILEMSISAVVVADGLKGNVVLALCLRKTVTVTEIL